mgnify:CR=1 FL=1
MGEKRFLAICLTPTMQRTLRFGSVSKGEVNRASERRIDASGKGVNVARVLCQLGHQADHFTHLGGSEAESFLSMLSQDDVPIIRVESNSEMRTCYTVLDEGEGSTTELVEEAPPIGEGTEERIRAKYLEILPSYHTVILSGSKSAGYSREIMPWMVKEAKKAGTRVLVDYRGQDLLDTLDYRPDVIKPNFTEFAGTFLTSAGSPFGPERAKGLNEQESSEELESAARVKMRELAELGIAVVLTRGSRPTLYALPGGFEGAKKPVRIEPVNTVGCGDAFTAGLAAELYESGDYDAALEKAHVCASMNAGKLRPGVIR